MVIKNKNSVQIKSDLLASPVYKLLKLMAIFFKALPFLILSDYVFAGSSGSCHSIFAVLSPDAPKIIKMAVESREAEEKRVRDVRSKMSKDADDRLSVAQAWTKNFNSFKAQCDSYIERKDFKGLNDLLEKYLTDSMSHGRSQAYYDFRRKFEEPLKDIVAKFDLTHFNALNLRVQRLQTEIELIRDKKYVDTEGTVYEDLIEFSKETNDEREEQTRFNRIAENEAKIKKLQSEVVAAYNLARDNFFEFNPDFKVPYYRYNELLAKIDKHPKFIPENTYRMAIKKLFGKTNREVKVKVGSVPGLPNTKVLVISTRLMVGKNLNLVQAFVLNSYEKSPENFSHLDVLRKTAQHFKIKFEKTNQDAEIAPFLVSTYLGQFGSAIFKNTDGDYFERSLGGIDSPLAESSVTRALLAFSHDKLNPTIQEFNAKESNPDEKVDASKLGQRLTTHWIQEGESLDLAQITDKLVSEIKVLEQSDNSGIGSSMKEWGAKKIADIFSKVKLGSGKDDSDTVVPNYYRRPMVLAEKMGFDLGDRVKLMNEFAKKLNDNLRGTNTVNGISKFLLGSKKSKSELSAYEKNKKDMLEAKLIEFVNTETGENYDEISDLVEDSRLGEVRKFALNYLFKEENHFNVENVTDSAGLGKITVDQKIAFEQLMLSQRIGTPLKIENQDSLYFFNSKSDNKVIVVGTSSSYNEPEEFLKSKIKKGSRSAYKVNRIEVLNRLVINESRNPLENESRASQNLLFIGVLERE